MYSIRLLLFLTYVSLSIQEICKFGYPQYCCVPQNVSEECKWNEESDVQWNLKDEQPAEFEVIFPNELACDVNSYDVVLYVVQVNNSAECNKTSEEFQKIQSNNVLYKHSDVSYTKKNNCNFTCQKNISITFNYIFTGCYFLKISPAKRPSIILANKYVETNYTKVTSDDYNPIIYVERRVSESKVSVDFWHTFLRQSNVLRIMVQCSACENFSSLDHFVYPFKNSTSKEEYNLDVCQVDRYHSNKQSNNIPEPECKYKNGTSNASIECFYKHLPYGLYSFFFYVKGENTRCKQYTIWGKGDICCWKSNKDLSVIETTFSTSESQEPDSMDTSLKYSLIMGSVLLVLLAVVIYCVIKKNRKPTQVLHEREEIEPINSSEIFLLYAKDCTAFMDLMDAFKTLLTFVGKFEVYDIYDNARYKEIAENPDNWIRDKLFNCKTILILTECANIQNEQNHRMTSIYRSPDCFDNYFLSSLRHINSCSGIASYKKLFVVTLNCDRNDYKSFRLLNPYTRFDLPVNFSKLIADLKDEIPLVQSVEEEGTVYERTCAYNIFLERYRKYEEYVKRQPNYLEELLKVEIVTENNIEQV